MKLVLTSEPISAQKLREAVGGNVDPTHAEVMVVTPALQENPKFWLSDADDAIARAAEVRRETVEQLSEDGISASADTGESDPLDAVGDALATFPADRIVIFTHPRDRSRYREDIDPGEVQERFGVPVDRATVRA